MTSGAKTLPLYDVAVIGGGPAGMMAAGRAAERGLSVILIEKNDSLGKKLLITGGGRSNITNAEFDLRVFLSKFKGNDKFLFSAFSQHGVQNSLDFFHAHDMPTKTEAEKRVFPISNKAQSVWNVLVAYMQSGKVTVLSNTPVGGFTAIEDASGTRIQSIRLKKNPHGLKEIRATSFILATGGTSRPETGSTGDALPWLSKLGHTVITPSLALVPVTTADAWVKRLQGVTLKDIKISLLQDGVKIMTHKGKILFTHFGISGPTILNMSRDIREQLSYGKAWISLDLLPTHDYGTLNTALQDIFKKEINKKIKNGLSSLIPSALVPVIIELSGINPDTFCHSVTREQRLALVQLLKDVRIEATGLLGTDKAIVTSGGVALPEIDWKTMRSRKVPNLHIIGDVLNIDRPSGGYSLQLCWTTGWVAGSNVGT
ncbi:MAG: Flavoprotein family protein [Parcubacteria bacterium C7867-002]|nr:MAG: Flavoprotein family protein [Parcubacteria bacterium C7867-002]